MVLLYLYAKVFSKFQTTTKCHIVFISSFICAHKRYNLFSFPMKICQKQKLCCLKLLVFYYFY